MISIELSRSFLEHLFSATGRESSIPWPDHYFEHHRLFLEQYQGDVDLEITDESFSSRREVAAQGLGRFLNSLARDQAA
jgi:hypothetical protein